AMLLQQGTPSPCESAIVNPEQPLMVRAGDQLAVAYETTPGTGFSWSITTMPDPGVLESLDYQVLPPPTPRPGGTGVACFVFGAVGSGTTGVEFAYLRPFEPDTPPSTTASITVVVGARAGAPVQVPNAAASR